MDGATTNADTPASGLATATATATAPAAAGIAQVSSIIGWNTQQRRRDITLFMRTGFHQKGSFKGGGRLGQSLPNREPANPGTRSKVQPKLAAHRYRTLVQLPVNPACVRLCTPQRTNQLLPTQRHKGEQYIGIARCGGTSFKRRPNARDTAPIATQLCTE